MTAEEYGVFLGRAVAEYAEDKARAGAWRAEEALERSRAEFEQLLPDGLATPGQLLFTAYDGDDAVGLLWLSLPAEARPAAWVFDVWVEPAARDRGYGRAIMLAGERELVKHGVGELALNVFGDNARARHLYESLGYRVTAQQMSKSLSGDSGEQL